MTRADSQTAGYFLPSRQGLRPGPASLSLIGGTPGASVANVVPGWYQGAAQPLTVSATLNGPVNSVTVVGNGAIRCTGSYGTLVGYDKAGSVLGSVALSLINPSDCGDDDITVGAAATLTVSQGVIARFDITPMSPLVIFVAGRASASYSVSLGVYDSPDYPPVPVFGATCGAAALDCAFNANGSQDDIGIASYVWDLAQSSGGPAGVNVSTTYPSAGWRRVRLTLTDTKGQTSRLLKWVGVSVGLASGPPVVRLTASCVQLTCTFTDNAQSATPDVYRTWDIGPDIYLNGVASPTVTFPAPGGYGVMEKIADGNGAYTLASTSVFVTGPTTDTPPVASFTWTCAGLAYPHQCGFNAGGSTDDVGIVAYRWDWGNGRSETKTVGTARNTWASAGTYQVTLTVTDTKGQTNAVTMPVVVP
jgi:PKD repeat protein